MCSTPSRLLVSRSQTSLASLVWLRETTRVLLSFTDIKIEKQRERELVEGELRKMITRAAKSCAAQKGFENFCVEIKDIEEFFREELRIEPASEDHLRLLYEYHAVHKCSRPVTLEREPESEFQTEIVKGLPTERAKGDQYLDTASGSQVGESLHIQSEGHNCERADTEAEADFAFTEIEVSSQRNREAGKGFITQTENEFKLETEIKMEGGERATLTYQSYLANTHSKMLEAKADRDFKFRVYLSKQGKPTSNADDTGTVPEEESSIGNSASWSFYQLRETIEKVVYSTMGIKHPGCLIPIRNTELVSAMDVFSQYGEEDLSMWRKEGRYVCHKFEFST